jgi:hypothetical protein
MLKYGGGGHRAVWTCQVPYERAKKVLAELVFSHKTGRVVRGRDQDMHTGAGYPQAPVLIYCRPYKLCRLGQPSFAKEVPQCRIARWSKQNRIKVKFMSLSALIIHHHLQWKSRRYKTWSLSIALTARFMLKMRKLAKSKIVKQDKFQISDAAHPAYFFKSQTCNML